MTSIDFRKLMREEARKLATKKRNEYLNKIEDQKVLSDLASQATQDIVNLAKDSKTKAYECWFGKESVESKRWVYGSELKNVNLMNEKEQFAFFEEVTSKSVNGKRQFKYKTGFTLSNADAAKLKETTNNLLFSDLPKENCNVCNIFSCLYPNEKMSPIPLNQQPSSFTF